MYLLLIIVISCDFYVGVKGGGGIVTKQLENGKDWPQWLGEKNKYVMGCKYRHKISIWTYNYDIQCVEMENDKILHIRYDTHELDLFNVTSCNVDTVVKSVFPPRRRHRYDDIKDHADDKGRPTVSYIKYKTQEGKCFVRKYKYVNGNPSVAERFEPEEIQCPGYPGFSKYGQADRFTECRIPKTTFSGIVKDDQEWKDWGNTAPEWMPDTDGYDEHKVHLECSFHHLVLTCAQRNYDEGQNGDYYAYVGFMNGEVLDILKVNSCGEDDIVNGIFPEKVPEDANKEIHRHKLWFSSDTGKCYSRTYPLKGEKVPDPSTENCPEYPDKWTNPYTGKLGQWEDCRGVSAGLSGLTDYFYHELNGRTDEWEEGKGIVKSVDATQRVARLSSYAIQHLQCNYRQEGPDKSHMYRVYCLEDRKRSKDGLKLLIKYDDIQLDTFVVTSCVPDDVIKSVFPFKQNKGTQDDGTAYYLHYKTTEGKCYSRKYKQSDGKFTERFEPDVVECEGKPGRPNNEELAEFANCRVSTLPLSEVVTNMYYGRADRIDEVWVDSPESSVQEGMNNNKLLECKYTFKERKVELRCVKDSKGVYLAFMHSNDVLLERIGVKSCDEEDIVNGIFISKDYQMGWTGFKFSLKNEKCLLRSYKKEPNKDEVMVMKYARGCARFPSDIPNVLTGDYVQWEECTGPRSSKQSRFSGETEGTGESNEPLNNIRSIEEDSGMIVKGVRENGLSWTEQMQLNVFTVHLMCKYRPEGETSPEQTFTIQCNEYQIMPEEEFEEDDLPGSRPYRIRPKKLLTLSVTYGDHKLDTFTVTSCELRDVVTSVFPAKQKPKGFPDEGGSPATSHIKYVTDKGDCFSRKFQLNQEGSPASRSPPEKIDCNGVDGLSSDREVAAFEDCRTVESPVSGIVVSWSPGPAYPKTTQKDSKRSKLLECTRDSPEIYERFVLKCYQGDNANDFVALVYFQDTWLKTNQLIERFTVSTCEEEKVLKGIFLKNPDRMAASDMNSYFYYHEIWFSAIYETCFLRKYEPETSQALIPENKPCPKNIDEWTNVKFSMSIKWDSCHNP